MKEQQTLNLDKCKELGKLEMSKEVVLTLNGMGTLAFFAFGFLFAALYTQFVGEFSFDYASGTILISIVLFIGTLVLHELIHGAFMSKYGGKPSYGAGIAYYILPYLYTTTKTFFPRNQFIVTAIAPFFVISLTVIGIMAAFPSIAHWMLIPFVINASGAVGDLWMIRNVLGYPKHVLLEDRKNELVIYGKETDKPLNISTTGLGYVFSKVFILSFFVMGFLMTMSPILLNILGVKSLAIGPTNSIFTIFEYHSIGEGFGFSFFPVSLIAISVIIGLVYAIINVGKPVKHVMTR
ncbi:MAG TPA: DUF3267 domain-containing protein [Methanosarcinaceae archaeon]|nr:DUF3267 domain-containing protein [Methanosarcinaceae archaeon]